MAGPVSVEGYLAGLAEAHRAAMQKLRETIRAVVPEATETTYYQMPSFREHGRFLVSYCAFKDHYSLYPADQVVKDALGEKLAPYLSGKAAIRFGWDERLPVTLVKKIVRVRLQENAARRRS